MRTFGEILLASAVVCLAVGSASAATDKCGQGASALGDARAIAAVRGAIARACPCADYDGSLPEKRRGRFVKCARAVISDATDGTPLLGAFTLRKECRGEVARIYSKAACGYPAARARVICCEAKPALGKTAAKATRATRCVSSASGVTVRNICYASPFAPDACSFDANNSCRNEVVQETVDLPSPAQPAKTPGSPGVVVGNPKLLAQFGGGSFSLNSARYTRYHLAGPAQQPDAVLVLVPGFLGGAGGFKILAENLITRAQAGGQRVEVWAYDRRTNQLEDSLGLDIAEEFLSDMIALDWLFGAELSLPLHPVLASGPNRRAVFYNAQSDIPFLANWTPLTFSRDIDVVVEAARAAARNQNVFLGGHSAGTGFAARYAATDFNLSGAGSPAPGYAKLRGLVFFDGAGGSTGGAPLTDDTLDRIEAKFDGGLFGAVRDNAPRCVDGVTPCTIATETVACAGQVPPKCTPQTAAYSGFLGILNPRILAAVEPAALQGRFDPNGGVIVIQADQGSAGNNAVAKVPDLNILNALIPPPNTVYGGIGRFIDDDNLGAAAFFVATSVGSESGRPPGSPPGTLGTWLDVTQSASFGPCPVPPVPSQYPPCVTPDNGAPPATLPGGMWGREKEVTRFDRLLPTYYTGGTNFTDMYYPGSGLSTTSVAGVCSAGICTVGNVGASCTDAAQCSQAISLDSTALSVGRGRRDIENLTQAANIDIPVVAFGGSNGLAPVPGGLVPFASSIGACGAPSCSGSTPRVVDATAPNPAFPTFGGIAGGFEVHISEGYAHVDVLTAEDDADNNVVAPLAAFLARNAQ